MRRPTRHAAKSRRGIPCLKHITSITSRRRHAERILAEVLVWGRVVAVVLLMIIVLVGRMIHLVERNEKKKI